MVVFFVLNFFVICVLGKICQPTTGSLLTLNEMRDCLSEIPFNVESSEINNLIPQILDILKNYPYIDSYRNPPQNNFLKFDLEEELNDIQRRLTSVDSDKITDGFTFYQEIVRVLKKMKDCHLIFKPPFLNKFEYVLPFLIRQEHYNGETYFYLQNSSFIDKYLVEFPVLFFINIRNFLFFKFRI
jgi:hypothetical protein